MSAQQHSRRFSHEPELPHTLPVTLDPVTGETSGVLASLPRNDTCPKFFNIDGESEYWNKSNSLHHTDGLGNDLAIQELAPNTRIYFIASIQHNTLFDDLPKTMPNCQQLSNPLYNGPNLVARGRARRMGELRRSRRPASAVPSVQATGRWRRHKQVRFPAIPATAYAQVGQQPPAAQFNPAAVNVNVVLDFSQVAAEAHRQTTYVTLVPQVDERRQATSAGSGCRICRLRLGTFSGWSSDRAGTRRACEPDRCGHSQVGQFIPFANTKAERLAAGDPGLRYRGASYSRWITCVPCAERLSRWCSSGCCCPRIMTAWSSWR